MTNSKDDTVRSETHVTQPDASPLAQATRKSRPLAVLRETVLVVRSGVEAGAPPILCKQTSVG